MSQEEEVIHVAVYGSLKKGYGNHHLLSSSTLCFAQWVSGFSMVSLTAFPACLEATEEDEVWVEVYQVTPETFRRLDQLEGYPRMYNRKQLCLDAGPVGGCAPWIYYMDDNRGKYPEVTDGFWKNPMAERINPRQLWGNEY